jgi:hypothetical protein
MHSDGSVVGTVRPRGQGRVHFAALPAGSVKVTASNVCARVPGLPVEPCFKVHRLSHRSFRGSLSGLGFAHCDFVQRSPRARIASGRSAPLSLTAIADKTPEQAE